MSQVAARSNAVLC